MKIVRKLVPEMTLSEFAETHGLTLQVIERPKSFGRSLRFYVAFENAEVMSSGLLVSEHGDGATEEEAICAYGCAISETRLVIDAYRTSRREIIVPRIMDRKHQ